jgi:hypothetical protein
MASPSIRPSALKGRREATACLAPLQAQASSVVIDHQAAAHGSDRAGSAPAPKAGRQSFNFSSGKDEIWRRHERELALSRERKVLVEDLPLPPRSPWCGGSFLKSEKFNGGMSSRVALAQLRILSCPIGQVIVPDRGQRGSVARPQGPPLDIAEPVEHEQRVIAGAPEMPIVGAAFLLAVGRALAQIHVEDDGLRRSPLMHLVDPLVRQIGEGDEPYAREWPQYLRKRMRWRSRGSSEVCQKLTLVKRFQNRGSRLTTAARSS